MRKIEYPPRRPETTTPAGEGAGCPKCGAAISYVINNTPDYACGSMTFASGHLHQSRGCRLAELEASLASQSATIERLEREVKQWKPMTSEEAEEELAKCEAVPITDERLNEILAEVFRRDGDPTYMPDEFLHVRLMQKVRRLEASLSTATERAERAEVELEELRLPQPKASEDIERQIRMHPFSSYVYCGDERLAEVTREFFRQFARLSTAEALAGAAPELTLPDREGWWWEWDNEAKEWKHPQHVIHYSGPLCLEADFGNPAPGRWVQCVPPPSASSLSSDRASEPQK